MLRYIILVWSVNHQSDCDRAINVRRRMQSSPMGWRPALDLPGLYVACMQKPPAGDAALLIDGGRGVILGTLFRSPAHGDSGRPIPLRTLSRHDSQNILQSMGRSLISQYWGYYVAVLHYPESVSAIVLRAPVSPLACFHVERGSLNLFFSHPDDCIDIEITPLTINWDSIAAQVVGADHLTAETAINEIESLECGESIQCDYVGCHKRAYWDPRSLLEERSPTSFEEAAGAIRKTTDYCVNALSSGHERILVKLSGGLDSSIILSSLSRAPHKPRITAVNYYSRGSGDERRFARIMAGAVGCQLIELPRNDQLNFRRFLDCNRTARPVLNFSAPDVEARNIALAGELNATAIFDGELGDNIFGSHPNLGAVLECLWQNGVGRELLRVVVDYSMLTRQSIWRTLALAWQEAVSVSEDPDFSASRELRQAFGAHGARSAILATCEAEGHHGSMADRFLHPWFKQARRISPSSHALLFGLVTVTSTTYHSPFSGPHDPPRVSPLVSQPLLEIALRMPAHLHCRFGQDRAVARAAFADVLPVDILQRGLGKGGPSTWIKEVIEGNTGFLREFLLNGILVRRHLIDRGKLEGVLSPRIVKSTVIAGDVFAKMYIEAWLRAWSQSTSPLGSSGT